MYGHVCKIRSIYSERENDRRAQIKKIVQWILKGNLTVKVLYIACTIIDEIAFKFFIR